MPTAAILTGGRAGRFGGCDKSALVVGDRLLANVNTPADDERFGERLDH